MKLLFQVLSRNLKTEKYLQIENRGVLGWPLTKIVKYNNSLNTESSFVFWFKISKELLGLDEDVIFGIVYIPPEYTVYSSIDAFSEIENEYLTLQRNYKYIVLNGDFNGRTANEPDFIFIEENLCNID
jgi:hypothetical protein